MPENGLPVRAVLQRAGERLTRHGVPDGRRQAFSLWSELSGDGWPAMLDQDSLPAAEVVDRFERAVERRTRGEPLPYVTGNTGFRHLILHTDCRALIPRPETEGLVDLLLERSPTGVLADVGTGTGCLALSLAGEGCYRQVVAIDASRAALALARENLAASASGSVVQLVAGDLTAPVRKGELDAIVSNPPYLTVDEYAALDHSVREWEPAVALVAGIDGMEIIARLVTEGWEALRTGGWLALEVDATRAELAAQFASRQGWTNVSIHKDLFGRERYLLAQRSDAP